MRICDYCQTKIDDGYLGYDYYVVCEDCINEIFWTTWYDEED